MTGGGRGRCRGGCSRSRVREARYLVEWIDDREGYGEVRINLLATSYRRGGRSGMNRTTITAKIRSDGKAVEVLPDGTEREFTARAHREMSEAEVSAAAAADPDARPMTAEELRAVRRVPRTKTLRRALGLTQEEFASRFQIPLGTLRDWEQGRCEPDQPARAYLRVIACDPEGVVRALGGLGRG